MEKTLTLPDRSGASQDEGTELRAHVDADGLQRRPCLITKDISMQIDVSTNKCELGRRAAERGIALIREALDQRGEVNIIVATGASQFEMLGHLVTADLPWHRVTAFHLDEYVGMPMTHRASFRLYLWQRFVSKLPLPLKAFHYIDAERDAESEARRVGAVIRAHPIDVAFVGIGENGHTAFNDPPADFETEEPFIVVELDEACRRQQLGEGWFPTLADVPTRAVSMSIGQILKSGAIVASVPDGRKARAVCESVEMAVSPDHPATCLQQHKNVWLFLDQASASGLRSVIAS